MKKLLTLLVLLSHSLSASNYSIQWSGVISVLTEFAPDALPSGLEVGDTIRGSVSYGPSDLGIPISRHTSASVSRIFEFSDGANHQIFAGEHQWLTTAGEIKFTHPVDSSGDDFSNALGGPSESAALLEFLHIESDSSNSSLILFPNVKSSFTIQISGQAETDKTEEQFLQSDIFAPEFDFSNALAEGMIQTSSFESSGRGTLENNLGADTSISQTGNWDLSTGIFAGTNFFNKPTDGSLIEFSITEISFVPEVSQLSTWLGIGALLYSIKRRRQA